MLLKENSSQYGLRWLATASSPPTWTAVTRGRIFPSHMDCGGLPPHLPLPQGLRWLATASSSPTGTAATRRRIFPPPQATGPPVAPREGSPPPRSPDRLRSARTESSCSLLTGRGQTATTGPSPTVYRSFLIFLSRRAAGVTICFYSIFALRRRSLETAGDCSLTPPGQGDAGPATRASSMPYLGRPRPEIPPTGPTVARHPPVGG